MLPVHLVYNRQQHYNGSQQLTVPSFAIVATQTSGRDGTQI